MQIYEKFVYDLKGVKGYESVERFFFVYGFVFFYIFAVCIFSEGILYIIK